MNTIQQLIQTHLTKYPLMELADGIKLLYQNGLGPGHMVTDETGSLERLYGEWENCRNQNSHEQKGCENGKAFEDFEDKEIRGKSSPFIEPIGNGLVRIYLHGIKEKELPILNAMFCQTANQMQGSKKGFIQNLGCLSSYFPNAEAFLEEYARQGYPPISHSTSYRQSYHPFYRVVLQSHAAILQLIRRIDALFHQATPKTSDGGFRTSLIIAIDGNCASGKTSLSQLLRMYFDCNVIPMDDFFLPPQLRTPARLSQPGGNVHYERFAKEVMAPLQNGTAICYRPFDCKTMDYGNSVCLPPKPLTIVEGSYCMHPMLQELYGYTVFLSCPYEQQLERIRVRNGEKMLKNFIEKWIPMENTYFSTFHIKENCNFIIETATGGNGLSNISGN